MMGLSLPHLLIVALVVLVLFGRGRISEMMGDFGKGIKSFKQGMADEENKPVVTPPAQIPAQPPAQPATQPQATLNGDTAIDPNQPGR
jgi:sec-independent protein translocase protein TatA